MTLTDPRPTADPLDMPLSEAQVELERLEEELSANRRLYLATGDVAAQERWLALMDRACAVHKALYE